MPDIARPVGEGSFRIPEMTKPVERKEDTTEHTKEQEEFVPGVVTEQPEETTVAAPTPTAQQTTALVANTKSPLRRDIEKILEQDLRSLYLELPDERKVIFRQQGDITASRIEYLMIHTKLKVGYLVYLVRRWLALIPGINPYFIEQESKIKAEQILFLNSKG